ncbi:3-hydroxyacyl-CoA dehydrogenase NAD-binding domain-containing protein [Marinibacterium sp. SX1]|uniref:3-hydroxyacyl-CoA dehydrogenase NAD-binding domain-containing protein n=1 Tax=Marinibacterium sp. SX1 TaxID=3388424 RepID=UPI003D17046D
MTRVACVGAGLVGSAWAFVFARGGCDVAVFDARGPAARDQTMALLDRTVEMTGADPALAGRVRFADSLGDALDGVSHVQESIKEDPAIKSALFAEMDALAGPETVLASSTSAILGSRFMDIPGAARALVAHPVNPPSLIPLVELCPTPLTAPETVARTREFMTGLGMKPVELTREIDGFLLNRLQYTLVAEAMHLVGEGYCSAADIDRVLTDGLALRWSTLGPFGVAHLNAAGGFADFVAHLGGMMRQMGQQARTDYDWSQEMVDAIHDDLGAAIPVDELAAWQAWRDENILATRRIQDEADRRKP